MLHTRPQLQRAQIPERHSQIRHIPKKGVATKSLVSTLDNVTFSVKNFEHRVHEHFLC